MHPECKKGMMRTTNMKGEPWTKLPSFVTRTKFELFEKAIVFYLYYIYKEMALMFNFKTDRHEALVLQYLCRIPAM